MTNPVQKLLVENYAILVRGKRMTIEQVPEAKVISGVEYPIRSEVELEIAKQIIEILG